VLPAARRTKGQIPVARRRRGLPYKRSLGLLAICLLVAVVFAAYHAGEHPKVKKTTTTTKIQLKPAPTTNPPTKPALPQTDVALQDILTTWASQHTYSTSVVVTELTGNTPKTTTYNSTQSIVPASTYKIYVAYAVLHAVEQGTYTLGTVTNDGNSIQTDLNNMILNSDNSAARTLGFMLGWKNINALLQTQGITHTDLYNYEPPSTQPVGDKHTTAADLATALQKLYNGALLNQDHTQLLIALMKQQHYRERIPAGVPSGVVVADKPGWLSPADGVDENIQNDAAIVYGPKSTYILVITTNGTSTQPLADLSRQIYTYLETL